MKDQCRLCKTLKLPDKVTFKVPVGEAKPHPSIVMPMFGGHESVKYEHVILCLDCACKFLVKIMDTMSMTEGKIMMKKIDGMIE